MVIDNLGKMHDLIYLLEMKFNSPQMNKMNDMWFDTDLVAQELYLFFFRTDNKKTLMEYLFQQYLCETLSSDAFGFLEKLSDSKCLTNQIIRFYFPDIEEKDVIQNCDLIAHIGSKIKTTDYSPQLKSSLYAYFIEPIVITHSLIYCMMAINTQLSAFYNSKELKQIELQKAFNDDSISAILRKNNVRVSDYGNVSVNFCLVDVDCFETIQIGEKIIITLGSNYSEKIKEKKIDLEIDKFGEALSESNRLKILDILLTEENITAQNLCKRLGLSGTNVYYHLTLMTKINMLLTEAVGRTLYYKINREYFDEIRIALKKYSNK